MRTAHQFRVEEKGEDRFVVFTAIRGAMHVHGTAMRNGEASPRPKIFDEAEWADIIADAAILEATATGAM